MFQVRKDGFKDNPSVPEELDLVEEEDQFTHMITLDDATSGRNRVGGRPWKRVFLLYKKGTVYKHIDNLLLILQG